MITDRFGKEIKVGDDYLYPLAGGRGSGALGFYTVAKIEPYPETEYEYEYDENGKIRRDERGWAIKHPVEVTRYRFMATPSDGGRQVRLQFPQRGLVITGIDWSKRHGEPQEAANANG